MSIAPPFSPEQIASWRHRDAEGIEPVTLDMPGFRVTERGPEDGCLPNQRVWIFENGDARVELTRHWDKPLTAGHPMVITSTRRVGTGAGAMLDVHTINPFEGFPRAAEVVFFNGPSFTVRVLFMSCDQATVDNAIARLSGIRTHHGPYR